jgi:hypothetical protein
LVTNEAKVSLSRPAQKPFPAPASTIARKPAARLKFSPAAMIASNIAGSSALSLSGRLSVTSATPSAISILTRSSDLVEALSCIVGSCIRLARTPSPEAKALPPGLARQAALS